jgi:transposase InsO family protein
MPGRAGLLELSAGSVLRLDGAEWTVAAVEAQYGRVLLGAGEEERWRSIRWLMHHPDCQGVPAEAGEEAEAAGQPASLDDLTGYQREVVELRVGHLLEAETGFRGGDPLHPGPGEPRPAYDPRSTTLGQRRQAKVAELKVLGADEAALLGLGQVSERTLKRMAAAWRRSGPAGCIDRRWLRAGGGHPSVTEEVREAIFAVRAETLRRSKMSMQARCVLVAQYVAEKFGSQAEVPSYWTLREVWLEWFGSGGTRQRYVRSAAAVDASQVHVVVHRPGQVVALDTTILPVKVRDGVFGEPVSAHLTLALDLFTHSVVAFRLTLVSDTSVDVAMLLRDVMMPLPMREGWGAEMEWPYPGVPASVVASFAGHRVAALPFFAPETVTTDHGSVYKSHALVEAQRVLGCNILPARTLRPQDKAACERAFGALRSLLFEQLPGYTGVDVADRGADPEADAVLTMAEMEHLIATWIVAVWQNRALGGHAPAWGPGEEHSPNTLFAAAMNQGGFALQVPRPELYYQILPAHHVKIHGDRGVKIGGLWYGRSHPALGPYQGRLSGRGGRHKGKWVIRSDRRDRRAVFFQDPADPSAWHVLRWNGLPPEGEIPAFSDKTAEKLLREARACGLSPQSDAGLLPVLLKLLGGLAPAGQWPTQLDRRRRRAAPARSLRATRQPVTGPPPPGSPGRSAPQPAPGERKPAIGGWCPCAGQSRQPGPGTPLTPSGAGGARRQSRSGLPRPGRWATGCAAPACCCSPRRTSSGRDQPGIRAPGPQPRVVPAGAGPGPDDLGGLEPVAAHPPGLCPRPGDQR